MRFTILASAILVPLSALAAPHALDSTALAERQNRPAKPKPCERISPDPTPEEYQARFDEFAKAFIYNPKNISRAFEFITQDYINHNPAAQNGFDSAWNILSPFWDTQNLTPIRTLYRHPQGWLNYRSGFGEVVDRFRWEGGCIAEHWDSGERFPANAA